MSNDYNELKGILRHYARECDLPYGEAFADAAEAIGDLQEKLSNAINFLSDTAEILLRDAVTSDLLAKVGEAACLDALMDCNMLDSGTDIPSVSVHVRELDGDKDAVFCFDDEPRRLAYVPGFDWMWYNAEGPEE